MTLLKAVRRCQAVLPYDGVLDRLLLPKISRNDWNFEVILLQLSQGSPLPARVVYYTPKCTKCYDVNMYTYISTAVPLVVEWVCVHTEYILIKKKTKQRENY